VTLYLAAMRIGAIPVPVSTFLPGNDVAELLRDSRAPMFAYSSQYTDAATVAAAQAPELRVVLTTDQLASIVPAATPREAVYSTVADSPAFWLYTSGTTGMPKAAMHRHGSVRVVCETYGSQVLGSDRKTGRCRPRRLFSRTGSATRYSFPLSAGASVILEAPPARPDTLAARVKEYGATLFFAGPTFFANMLRADLPANALAGVRLAVSAGEALPAGLYHRWTDRFGIDILDGHRHDRDAAHLPVQPARRREGRHHRRRGSWLRPAHRR
jgi:acyl-coenzyme A synthetase/AMP-(fatty) acid ligase